MSQLQITEVTSRAAMRTFLRLPWQLYAGDRQWVPPLRYEQRRLLSENRHPFWRHYRRRLFITFLDGRACGRIAAIAPQEHRGGTGYFGFLEAVERKEVFESLLGVVAGWLRRQGLSKMLGPVNPGFNYELGILLDGYDRPPYFMMPHNLPFYGPQLEACGMIKAMDFLAYRLPIATFQLSERLQRLCRYAEARYAVRIRSARMDHFREDLARLGELYNAAFAGHWGFQAMSEEEIKDMAQGLRYLVAPELVLFAEYRQQAIGFLLSVPNINEILIHNRSGRLFPDGLLRLLTGIRRIRSLRVMVIAVHPAFRHLGAAPLLYETLSRRVVESGRYDEAEFSWVAENNEDIKQIARLSGAQPAKRYRIYESSLSNFDT